jgi:hypothetical protein
MCTWVIGPPSRPAAWAPAGRAGLNPVRTASARTSAVTRPYAAGNHVRAAPGARAAANQPPGRPAVAANPPASPNSSAASY